jgi:hypothetical protein
VEEVKTGHFSKGIQWSLELMGMTYVAMGILFLVHPDWIILVTNQVFAGYDWPVVFFPTERFWFALAVTVPGTRAFLAFTAARRPTEARLCIKILQVSLVLAAILFALQFNFRKYAPLYALGFFLEAVQVVFYLYLYQKLP